MKGRRAPAIRHPRQLLFSALALILITQRRYWMASLSIVISMLVRQNNVVWLGLLSAMTLTREGLPRRRSELLRLARANLGVLLAAALFVLFVYVNEGVAIGHRAAHHTFSIHPGNVIFTLFMIGIFFLPVLALRGKEVLFERRPLWHYTALMTVLCALILLYENSHPFNRIAWFPRNRLLIYAAQTYVNRALFFVPVLLGLILVAHCMRRNLELTVALGLSAVYLAAHWLIEPRYSFLPLALLILLRRSEEIRTEIALLSWFALGASYLFVGTAFGWFFI